MHDPTNILLESNQYLNASKANAVPIQLKMLILIDLPTRAS